MDRRIRKMRLSEISQDTKESTEEIRKQQKATKGRMNKLTKGYTDIFEGVGKYKCSVTSGVIGNTPYMENWKISS